MTAKELMGRLRGINDLSAQRMFLDEHASLLSDDFAAELKALADHYLRSDIQRSFQVAELLLYQAKLTNDPRYRALGLLAKANAHSIGLGEHQKSIELYNEATIIYQDYGDPVDQAKSQIGKLWALASLGQYDEVMETGNWARQILEEQEEWLLVGKLTGNMGIIYGRIGEDEKALSLFDKARDMYVQYGAGVGDIAGAEYNRAIVLRNLGQLEASIKASQAAIQLISQTNEPIREARAKQSLAITYMVLGRYNETLSLLEDVKTSFLADGRQRHALLTELFISDCLLQLRRYVDVLEKCREARWLFSELGTHLEIAQTILNEALAYVGLKKYPEAQASLAEARSLFQKEGNLVWVATTDLERANILYREEKFERSFEVARTCQNLFQSHNLPYWLALAKVSGARAAAGLMRFDQALRLVNDALEIGKSLDIPTLTYQCHQLLGNLARSSGDSTKALSEYHQTIEELERLRGRLMVEFRIDFHEDKELIYEEVVDLCIDMNMPVKGLDYAERAKSRALLELLTYRLDLSIEPRTADDRPIVEALIRLRAHRDQLVRRWEGDEEARESRWISTRGEQQQIEPAILAVETQIMQLWHKLLVRNADYARDASLWHIRTEPIQPFLNERTLLLEYFVVHGALVVFLVTTNDVQVRRLAAEVSQIRQLLQLLWLNLKMVPKILPQKGANLEDNSQQLLHQLHKLLILPVIDELSSYQQLIIVPHGVLHYLPFHALYDGNQYLLESYEMSYLPGASILRFCQEASPNPNGILTVGYSSGGRLPYAVQEVEIISAIMGGHSLLEEQATLSTFQEIASDYQIVHLASHGDFRADNPLFSSLTLADGWLTTLDIFNLKLNASLVTLSGCETGRHVIGGGDELLGLMRAFLYAGTASLVLSMWSIEDRSTALLMRIFYEQLAGGRTKAAALRTAQLRFIHSNYREEHSGEDYYRHPYYWASFNLIGAAGLL